MSEPHRRAPPAIAHRDLGVSQAGESRLWAKK